MTDRFWRSLAIMPQYLHYHACSTVGIHTWNTCLQTHWDGQCYAPPPHGALHFPIYPWSAFYISQSITHLGQLCALIDHSSIMIEQSHFLPEHFFCQLEDKMDSDHGVTINLLHYGCYDGVWHQSNQSWSTFPYPTLSIHIYQLHWPYSQKKCYNNMDLQRALIFRWTSTRFWLCEHIFYQIVIGT